MDLGEGEGIAPAPMDLGVGNVLPEEAPAAGIAGAPLDLLPGNVLLEEAGTIAAASYEASPPPRAHPTFNLTRTTMEEGAPSGDSTPPPPPPPPGQVCQALHYFVKRWARPNVPYCTAYI